MMMGLVEQVNQITFGNKASGTSYEDVLVMEERDDGKARWRVIRLIMQVLRRQELLRATRSLQEGGIKEHLSLQGAAA